MGRIWNLYTGKENSTLKHIIQVYNEMFLMCLETQFSYVGVLSALEAVVCEQNAQMRK